MKTTIKLSRTGRLVINSTRTGVVLVEVESESEQFNFTLTPDQAWAFMFGLEQAIPQASRYEPRGLAA